MGGGHRETGGLFSFAQEGSKAVALDMSGRGIIEDLYDPQKCSAIRKLWKDEGCRQSLRQSVGMELTRRDDLLLVQPGIDILMLVCSTSPFASDEQECATVAAIVTQGIQSHDDPLPSLMDESFAFSLKTLTSLSFFLRAMERRHQRRGAPAPNFYRERSRSIFRMFGHPRLADHHVAWENFLAEKLGA